MEEIKIEIPISEETLKKIKDLEDSIARLQTAAPAIPAFARLCGKMQGISQGMGLLQSDLRGRFRDCFAAYSERQRQDLEARFLGANPNQPLNDFQLRNENYEAFSNALRAYGYNRSQEAANALRAYEQSQGKDEITECTGCKYYTKAGRPYINCAVQPYSTCTPSCPDYSPEE